jgi:hypothetical protein
MNPIHATVGMNPISDQINIQNMIGQRQRSGLNEFYQPRIFVRDGLIETLMLAEIFPEETVRVGFLIRLRFSDLNIGNVIRHFYVFQLNQIHN